MEKIALMVSNVCTLGGTERVTANLSKDLSQYFDCTIITQWCNGEYAYPIANNVKVFNLYDKQKRLRYIAFNAVKRIREYVMKNNIEMIIVVGRNNGIIPLLVKLVTPVKLIYCEHNSIASYRFYNESLKAKVYRNLLQIMLYHIPNCVVTLTKKDLAYYQNTNMPCCTVYNAIDDKLLDDIIEYNVDSKKIITVGRIDYQKGYEYLIEVAKRVLEKYPDWTWDVYGDGIASYKSKMLSMVKKYGLEGKLNFKGNTDKIYSLYNNYSFYVMTSRYEGLPMVLLEAKSKKLPIVSFDINSGPSDIVRDEVDGYLVKGFNTEVMFEKISYLIKHSEVRKKFSANTYGNIDKFRKENITKQWIKIINNTLKTGVKRSVDFELDYTYVEMVGVLPC